MARKPSSAKPPPQTLVEAVFEAIDEARDRTDPPLDMKHHLINDLRISSFKRKNLAYAFTRVTAKYKSGSSVSRSECDRLRTVRASVNLVATRSGFERLP